MDIGSNTVSCLNRRKNTKNIKKSNEYIDKLDAECYYITIKERKKSPKDI